MLTRRINQHSVSISFHCIGSMRKSGAQQAAIQASIETRDDRRWKHIEPGKFIGVSLLSDRLSKRSSKRRVKYVRGLSRTLAKYVAHGFKPRPVRLQAQFQSLSKKFAPISTTSLYTAPGFCLPSRTPSAPLMAFEHVIKRLNKE